MEVFDHAPDVSLDGGAIVFRLSDGRGDVECAVTREALAAHFWLPTGADASRMLKTFADGRQRIVAVAERKLRVQRGASVRLDVDDFLVKR